MEAAAKAAPDDRTDVVWFDKASFGEKLSAALKELHDKGHKTFKSGSCFQDLFSRRAQDPIARVQLVCFLRKKV